MDLISLVPTVIVTAVGFLIKSKLNKLDKIETDFNKHLVDDAKLAGHIEELKPQLDRIADRLDRLAERPE